MSDWGSGEYERTAAELHPAAVVAIDAAAVQPGERLLDLACGTGNAALVAAGRGARVTGADAAPRLVDVARERTATAGHDAEFVVADALALPFADDHFDVAVSVFGLIFAAPSDDAVTELVRVVAPGGRIVVTSWLAEGPIYAAGRLLRTAVSERIAPSGPAPADWNDPEVIASLFAPHGAQLQMTERQLPFTRRSAQALTDEFFDHHPVWVNARAVLGDAIDELRAPTTQLLQDAGDAGGDGWHYTGAYRVTVAELPA